MSLGSSTHPHHHHHSISTTQNQATKGQQMTKPLLLLSFLMVYLSTLPLAFGQSEPNTINQLLSKVRTNTFTGNGSGDHIPEAQSTLGPPSAKDKAISSKSFNQNQPPVLRGELDQYEFPVLPAEPNIIRELKHRLIQFALPFLDAHPLTKNISRGYADGITRSSLGFIVMANNYDKSLKTVFNVTRHLPVKMHQLRNRIQRAYDEDKWRTIGETSYYVGLFAYHFAFIALFGHGTNWFANQVIKFTGDRMDRLLVDQALNFFNQLSAVMVVILVPIGTFFGPSSDALLSVDSSAADLVKPVPSFVDDASLEADPSAPSSSPSLSARRKVKRRIRSTLSDSVDFSP